MLNVQPQSTPRQAPIYIGSEVFRRAAFGANHPLNIVRHSAVLDLVKILGWLPGEGFRNSRAVDRIS
jgi:acetoin utilization protein AcuC